MIPTIPSAVVRLYTICFRSFTSDSEHDDLANVDVTADTGSDIHDPYSALYLLISSSFSASWLCWISFSQCLEITLIEAFRVSAFHLLLKSLVVTRCPFLEYPPTNTTEIELAS